MHAITVPTFQHAPETDDDVPVPVYDTDKIVQMRYALDALLAHGQRDNGLLAPVSDDLTEAFLLLIPAAVHVEDNTEQAAS